MAALFVILLSQGQIHPTPTKSERKFDENRYPIAEYLATESKDPAEKIKRQLRSEKRDNSDWQVSPKTVGDTTTLVDKIDPKLPALPFTKSSLVVVGQIMDARAFLSKDKSGVYSSFNVQVNEVIKNSSKIPFPSASMVEIEREGGRVRFPSGRLHLYLVDGLDMPMVGLRHLLFLDNSEGESVFSLVTGYELKDGKVYALDSLLNSKSFESASELPFLANIRTIASKP